MFTHVAFIDTGTKFSQIKKRKEKIMREEIENTTKIAETVCALTMVVMNILFLTIVVLTVWIAHSILSEKRFLEPMVYGNFLP